MISMSIVHSIQQMRKSGSTISDIARKHGITRDTVYRYLKQDDFSPKVPVEKSSSKSILDPYKDIIDSWLIGDQKEWKKQHHTAHRIWERLKEEYGAEVSESTVRKYVRARKQELFSQSDPCFIDLNWKPAVMQIDFGEVDIVHNGAKVRMHHFVATFPYSNVGFCQLFPGQTAECVCEGLKAIFEYIGGVPAKIVFDNATGIGRRINKVVSTTKLFEQFAVHYAFDFEFCNPYSGHEKGNVENKVGTLRRNLFIPVPRISNIAHFNKGLLAKSWQHSDRVHWRKRVEQHELFEQDKDSLYPLPSKPFEVVRFEHVKADRYAKVTLDGLHRYALGQRWSHQEVIVGYEAFNVRFYSTKGELLKTYPREYGCVPTDTTNPTSEIALLYNKPRAWENSMLRDQVSPDVCGYLDSLSESLRKACFKTLSQATTDVGWEITHASLEQTFLSLQKIDQAAIALTAQRIKDGLDVLDYDSKPDLTEYDQLFRKVV